MSSVFIQVLMTRFFDLVTGKNLKTWLQQDSLLRSEGVEATTQTQGSRKAESHGLLSRIGVSRTCSVEKNLRRAKLSKEISCTINTRDVLLPVDLVTCMSISEVLVETCWSNATTAKVWNLPNFCQYFARQKLEVNKIGSSATWP